MKSRIQIRIGIKIMSIQNNGVLSQNVHTVHTVHIGTAPYLENAKLCRASKNPSVPTTLLEFDVAVLQLPVPPLPPPFLLRSLSPSEPEKEFRLEPEAEEFPLWLPLFFSPGRLDRVVLSLNNTDFKLILSITFLVVFRTGFGLFVLYWPFEYGHRCVILNYGSVHPRTDALEIFGSLIILSKIQRKKSLIRIL
jgi:hypothetical protein